MMRRSRFFMLAAFVLSLCCVHPQGVAQASLPAVPPTAGGALAQSAPPAPSGLAFDRAVQTALDKNPQVTAAREAVVAAEQHVIQARAGQFPGISVTGTTSYGTATVLGPPASDPRSNSTVSLTGALSIYDNGRTGIAIEQAQAALAAAQAVLRQTQQDVALSAATAFFNVLKAERLAAARQAQLEKAQGQLEQAQAQVRAGVAAQADVIQAQAQVAQAQVDLLAARSQIETGKGALRSVLAMDLLAPIELQEPRVQPVALTLTAEGAVKEAQESRPEVAKAAADVQTSTAALAFAYANAGFQVSVGLNSTYVITSTVPAMTSTTSWALAAIVTLPLFDAGKGEASINEAAANLRVAQAKAEATRLAIRQDAYQAYLAAVQATANLDATQAAQAAADEALRVAEGRYRAGVGTILEVTTARAQAAQAEVVAITARFDYQAALATLRHALGRPIVGGAL